MLGKMTSVGICASVAACAGAPADEEIATVQNVGLTDGVAVPPKGVGVAPILGYPGQTPASVPAASVGASGAPGSIALYGGQWVLPLPVAPGAKIANVSCDMITNSSTVATMELVGRSGTVTSKTIGPANGVHATLWLLPTDADPNGYAVGDGEHVVLRLSFRDSATGTWSTGAQQMPIAGCAVNAVNTCLHFPIAASRWRAVTSSGTFPILSSDGTWYFDPVNTNELVADVAIPSGSKITSVQFHFSRNNPLHPATGVITMGLHQRVYGSPGTTSVPLTTTAGQSTGTGWATGELIASGTYFTTSNPTWLSIATTNFFGNGDPGALFDNASIDACMP
jgi:hypothetical protein